MKNYINHFSLTVTDAKASAEFYANALDLKIKTQEDDFAMLVPKNGDKFLLVLNNIEEKDMVNTLNKTGNRLGIGVDHFAFLVDTLEDLKGIESRLKKAGIEMEEGGIIADEGYGMSIFSRDPDNMKFEVRFIK